MDRMFSQNRKETLEALTKESDKYGLTFSGDGATIARYPLHNLLGHGVHKPVAVLAIKDCTDQMKRGGKKDAVYLSGITFEQIDAVDPGAINTSLLCFDVSFVSTLNFVFIR